MILLLSILYLLILISKRFFCPTGRTVIYTFYDNLPEKASRACLQKVEWLALLTTNLYSKFTIVQRLRCYKFFKGVVKLYKGTLIGVLGWVCIGIALCIGQLGRKLVYVCFQNGMKKEVYDFNVSRRCYKKFYRIIF